MTKKITLKITDELAEQIEQEYDERRERAVESMEAHGWTEQANKLQNTDIAGNTAEKTLFILRQEVKD